MCNGVPLFRILLKDLSIYLTSRDSEHRLIWLCPGIPRVKPILNAWT